MGGIFAALKKKLGDGSPDLSLSIDTQPVPATRPRVSRWGTYYAKTYRRWRDQAKRLLAEMPSPAEPITKPVAVLTEIVVQQPRTSKLKWPKGDSDNFEKAAWDAVTNAGTFWKDDDQIIFNATWKRWAKKDETPGTRIHVFKLQESP